MTSPNIVYVSTRGGSRELNFEETLLTGFADDGGLMIPKHLPKISTEKLKKWRSLNFVELALEITCEFISDKEVPRNDLYSMLKASFSVFDVPEIVPVKKVGEYFIAELFHGPTYAFKDIALQFVGALLDYFLKKRNERMTVLVATSGDTGSAAIYGIRGKKNIECFVLYPKGRISEIQEKQMITVLDENVHVICMDAPSDDLDVVVKNLFNDLDFKRKHNLCSINSINWARIMLQTIHYFFSYFRVCDALGFDDGQGIIFSIPTGAFGNGTSGIIAKMMGLPIEKLLIATNENDILYQFFTKGTFQRTEVVQTVSPSIDIQVPYNFERFLYYLTEGNSAQVKAWMEEFQKSGKLTLDSKLWNNAKTFMWGSSVNSKETLETMARYYHQYNYLLDPHSAVGVHGAEKMKKEIDKKPVICLATADACKFAASVQKAIQRDPPLPKEVKELEKMPVKFVEFAVNLEEAEKRLRVIIAESFKN